MLTPLAEEPDTVPAPAFETLSRRHSSQDCFVVRAGSDSVALVPAANPTWQAVAGGVATALLFGVGGGFVFPGRWWASVPVGLLVGGLTTWLKLAAERAAAAGGPYLEYDTGRRVLTLPRQRAEFLPERIDRLQLVTFCPYVHNSEGSDSIELQLVDDRGHAWLVAAGLNYGGRQLRRPATDLGRCLNLPVIDVNVTERGNRRTPQAAIIKPLFTPDGAAP